MVKSYLELHFTDLAGVLRSTMISVESKILENSDIDDIYVLFDASSVYGFEKIENSDLVLKPVKYTLSRIPWTIDLYRVIAQVYRSHNERYVKDPRLVAEKLIDYTHSMGYIPYTGVEMEFFIFDKLSYNVTYTKQYVEIHSNESPGSRGYGIAPKKGYHLPYPFDTTLELRKEIIRYLNEMGYDCIKSHHEVASYGQLEVTSKRLDPLHLSDFIQTFKYVAKTIAYRHGKIAVFMPKPIPGDNGCGMHVHVSLWDSRGRNLFYDPNEPGNLSEMARYFIGGLIEHGRSLSAFVSPTVNSYKRLIPGYEAPVYLVWGFGNRSVAIRVPTIANGESIRIEYRPPDPSANPYLAIPALIMAGLDGVKKKIDPGDPCNKNAYSLTGEERKKLGIKELPGSLAEALEELESDNEYLKPVFPKEVIETYIELKRKEVREVSSYPSPIEFQYYIVL